MTAEGRATHYPAPTLMSDLNDEVCRICWQGVSIFLQMLFSSSTHLLWKSHSLVSTLPLGFQGRPYVSQALCQADIVRILEQFVEFILALTPGKA